MFRQVVHFYSAVYSVILQKMYAGKSVEINAKKKKRTPDVTAAFKSALDRLGEQTDLDLAKVLFNLNSS